MEIDASSASSDSNLSQYNPNNNQAYYNNGLYCAFKKTDYEQYISPTSYYKVSDKKIETLFTKDKKDVDGKKIISYENGGFYTSLNKVKDGFDNVDGKKLDEINGYLEDSRKNEWNNKKTEGSIHLNTVEPFPKKTLSFSPEQVRTLFNICKSFFLSGRGIYLFFLLYPGAVYV